MYYDGAKVGNMKDVAYVPTEIISRSPTGGGVVYEPVNLISPKRTDSFLGDDTHKTYQLVANNIESVMLEQSDRDFRNRINSIGYGEFLPSKNTSNNGGKYANRVDIIILCNISGE